MKKHFEHNIIIMIELLKSIMGIFLGPFLTMYFIKVSMESTSDLAIYYILSYLILGLTTFVIAGLTNNKFKIGMFRVGVILNFLYIMSIVILKENIVNNIGLVSILYGISMATYYFPYNLFLLNKVDNKDRTEHTVKSKTLVSLVNIICPILLGSIITVTNFLLTAYIILFLSIIQIVLSFMLKNNMNYDYKEFNLIHSWKRLRKNKQVKNTLKVEYFIGMNINGALGTLMTILIFNSFKTNMNLGIINSITALFTIIVIKLYGKIYKGKDDKNIIILSSIVPLISLVILLVLKCNITVIIYNLCYSIFTNILLLTRDIRLYNVTNSNMVVKEDRTEFFAIREFVLNLGRVTSYGLLLVAGIFSSTLVLNIILMLLTLSILVTGLYIKKTNKFEYIKNDS